MPCWIFAVRIVCLALTLAWLFPSSAAANRQQDTFPVSIGIAGTWKLGQPCPVRITIPDAYVADLKSVEIDSVDGDGVAVTYRQPVESQSLS